jgi:hypothetical protein
VIKADNTTTIVINELMSSNTATIADANGEFEDWIELYNYGDASVGLSGLYLTDKSAAPKYWALTDIIMPAGSFLLIWADKERHQGDLHAPFALSASGEQLFLMKSEPNGLGLVDYITFPSLATDISWGRAEDAQLPWIGFTSPTPGASNQPLTANDYSERDLALPYPNPVADELHLPVAGAFSIYDIRGALVLSGNAALADVAGLAQGVYVLKMKEGIFRIVKTND